MKNTIYVNFLTESFEKLEKEVGLKFGVRSFWVENVIAEKY